MYIYYCIMKSDHMQNYEEISGAAEVEESDCLLGPLQLCAVVVVWSVSQVS